MKIIIASIQKHFADAFRIRTNVFIGEQSVPAHEEIDELDCYVPILVAYNDQNQAIGTARIIEKSEKIAKIGRVAVSLEARGNGVGRELMKACIEYISKHLNSAEIHLDAQLTAQKFYETLGFVSYGDIFKDAGIDHIAMIKKLDR